MAVDVESCYSMGCQDRMMVVRWKLCLLSIACIMMIVQHARTQPTQGACLLLLQQMCAQQHMQAFMSIGWYVHYLGLMLNLASQTSMASTWLP